MKWIPMTSAEWDRDTFTAQLSPYAYRIGPRWSPRRKIRRKRNRQWVRNLIATAKKAKTLTCGTETVEGMPVITWEIESEIGETIRYEIMWGTSTATAAVSPIKIDNLWPQH